MIAEHYHIRKWLDDPIKFLTAYYKGSKKWRGYTIWSPLIIKAEKPHLSFTSLIGKDRISDVYVPEGIEVVNCAHQSDLKNITLPISIQRLFCDNKAEIENLDEIMEVNPDVEIIRTEENENFNPPPMRKHYWM